MKNKLWLIALIAVIGFMILPLAGCDNGTTSGGGGGGEKPVISIEITSPPTKTQYETGETIDLTGMVITVTYKDGTAKEISIKDLKVSGYDKNIRGNQTVTISYGGKSDTFTVNVINPNLPVVATPTASPQAGNYYEAISVTLSTETEDVTIYYTTNGEDPTEESDVYSGEIDITETTTLKAFAVKEDMNDSGILTAEYIFAFAAAPGLSLVPDNGKITCTWTASEPEAETYDLYWKEGDGLSAAEVKTGTKIPEASSGKIITGLVNGTAYSFIVTANKQGYPSIDSAVQTAIPAGVYVITGSGEAFTASKAGAALGTEGPIQTAIDAIRTDANGAACVIQFGDGTTTLNIGTAAASFNNTGGTWGFITLTGKITGSANTTSTGVITIAGGVSVSSTADIANTATGANGMALRNSSSGTVTISGGTVSATTGRAVYNLSSGSVTISGGTVKATANGGDAVSNTSTGVVTISGGTVSATTGWAVYNLGAGKINVSETAQIRSANTDAAQGTIYLADNGIATAARLEISGGTVENTSTGNAIYNASTGAVTMSGGTVSATTRSAVYNYSTGAVTISGGTVSATTGTAVSNYSTGVVTISGGTVSTTGNLGFAVYNNSTGTVNISGGTVSATTGVAAYNSGTGKITVSGTAKVSSANISAAAQGTIYLSDNGTATAARLEISGGTVENTADNANARTIYNASTGAVTISGGTVQAATGYSVYMNNASAMLTLGGSPDITGRIRPSAEGQLTAASGFTPQQKTYTLEYASYAANRIAVVDGASYLSNFTLYNQMAWLLDVSGNNIIIVVPSTPYIITGANGTFTAVRDSATIATGAIQTVIDAIRTNVGGITCVIQFGDGSAVLDIGAETASFNSTGGTWGAVRLTGKITGNIATDTTGTITIANAVSITSAAEIENTNVNWGIAVRINSTGTVNISGGTVTSAKGYAVYNYSTGTVNISGGTVTSATDYAVYNNSTGKVNISGGTVSSVYNYYSGSVTISGGTVSSVYNYYSGSVIISGGTVSSVYNRSTGKITVSGTAKISSASDTGATIEIANNETSTATRLEITGGTVENTGTGKAISNSSTGAVTISGGTVSATTGYAVYMDSYYSNTSMLTLNGSPAITGRIRPSAAGKLTVASGFTPQQKTYTLEFASYAANNIAVTGGASYLSNFTLYNQAGWSLDASGNNIIIVLLSSLSYIITGANGTFTAARDSEIIATGAIETVIDAVQTDASRAPFVIQFGDGSAVLDIGTATASFSNGSLITLSGKITSSSSTYSGTIAVSGGISVTSTADIANTDASGKAVYSNSSGTVNISGGTVSATGNSGYAVYNNSSTGTVNISGGTVSATTGVAVYNSSTGKITVSGTAKVTSANITATQGTIYLAVSGTATAARLEISGGTVENTANNANARTIYNASTGAVTISGGTVSATTGYAVYMNNASAMLTLDGSPAITGRIRPSAAGKLTAASGFTPGAKNYTLEFASYVFGNIAVTGGASYLSNFALYNRPVWLLRASGDNLVFAINTAAGPYIINGSNTSFTATIAGETIGTANQPIQTVIDAIRTTADGAACSIQFGGGGSAVLDIGAETASFNNTGGTWGLITLTGKITSSDKNIGIADNVSVTSRADLTNTGLYHNSTGTLTISGGTVSRSGYAAVTNNSTGTVNISGGTVSSETGTTVSNGSGTVTISGGTVSATTGRAVSGSGTVTISGGTVSATTGTAVYNGSGTVTISGGTVSATTGVAVNSAGKITVSGTAKISSANVTYTSGTIVTREIQSPQIEITGGTVENTASNANASAVYNYSGNGVVTISGGTVSATTDGTAVYNYGTGRVNISGGTVSATTGRAVYNNSTGAVTISGGTVSATTGRAVYNGSTAAVNISGGTVSATTGVAVYNGSTGKITVSQASGATTKISSANTSSSTGTIYLTGNETDTTARLEITGGTVSNTSTTTGNAIRNDSKGSVSITGGTVSKAGSGTNANYAVYNNSTGVVTIGTGATIVGNRYL